MGSIPLLLVEDDAVLRRALSAFLASEGFHVHGCADGRGGLEAAEGPAPFAAALVDLGLPDAHGADVVRALRRARPGTPALVLTVLDDGVSIAAALAAGAHGYLLKDDPPEDIVRHIHLAIAGGAPLSPRAARTLVRSFWAEPAGGLTTRERELLELFQRGCTYEDAARAMGVRVGTVQGYVKQLYAKLDATSKVEAVRAAVRRGLVAP